MDIRIKQSGSKVSETKVPSSGQKVLASLSVYRLEFNFLQFLYQTVFGRKQNKFLIHEWPRNTVHI